MKPWRLLASLLLMLAMLPTAQGCQFAAGVATGAVATEAAEEIDGDDDD